MMIVATLIAMADVYVVSSQKAQVHEAGDESSEVLGTLARGMELEVSKIESGFCRIDFMGIKGYVSVNDLKFKSATGKKAKPRSQDDDASLGEKTKDFVSNTSRKVADGVTGFTGKLFGKKKERHEAEVQPAEDSAPVVRRLLMPLRLLTPPRLRAPQAVSKRALPVRKLRPTDTERLWPRRPSTPRR